MKPDHKMSELEIQMAVSAAFNYIGQISLAVPIDVNNKEERNTAISVCCSELVSALDNGRIKFESNNEKTFFHWLLAIAGDIAMEGRLKEVFGTVTLN